MMDLTKVAELEEELLKFVKKGGRQNFEQHSELVPMAFILATRNPDTGQPFAKPTIIILPLDINDEDTKEETFERIARISRLTEAVVVCTLTEAWIAELSKEEAEKVGSKDFVMPSKHPKRIEAVLLSVESTIGSHLWTAKIQRPKKGTPTLGEWETSSVGELTGRMTGFVSHNPIGRA